MLYKERTKRYAMIGGTVVKCAVVLTVEQDGAIRGSLISGIMAKPTSHESWRRPTARMAQSLQHSDGAKV